jgi:hypothetical protein
VVQEINAAILVKNHTLGTVCGLHDYNFARSVSWR